MTNFCAEVYRAVAAIPKGEVRTYKQVAITIGKPGAYRAVANCLAQNTDQNIPCHRVIRSDGSIGGYNGLRGDKLKLLQSEQESRIGLYPNSV